LAKSNQFTFLNDTLGFKFQHYASRLPNGNITLFDNGAYGFSRAVEYEIDEYSKTAKLVFQYRNTPDIYSSAMGSVIRLTNGNTFIGWGSVTKMTEVDTAGNKVFEASFPSCTYRALKYDIPNPISQLLSGPSEICEGQTASYTALPCTNCSYSWTITNGTIISGQGTSTLVVKWTNDGQGIVRLTKTNPLNYKDYFRLYVNVFPVPSVNMGVTQICNGARFIDNTANSVNRFWNFGDGDTSNLSDINHIYNSSGVYRITLKVINNYGCMDSSFQNLVIPDEPIAEFSIDSLVCANEKITIINNSTNSNSYFWDFGDSMTSSLQHPSSFYYNTAGTYEVMLIASASGCSDSLIKNIIVYPSPKAFIGFNGRFSG